jgi:NAD(P)H-hydrate epimerase
MKVFSVAEMVKVEKAADAAGVSYGQMMETAGQAVAEAIVARRTVQGSHILLMVGPGNNGGDGLVAGRHLAQSGADVTFYLYRPRNPHMDHNYALIREMGLPVLDAGLDGDHQQLVAEIERADILVDGLLGTGVTRAIGGDLGKVMNQVKLALAARAVAERRGQDQLMGTTWFGSESTGLPSPSMLEGPPQPGDLVASRPYVVAIDCPSGLNCDTGDLDPLAIPAQMTVTFAGPKRGHFRFPGAAACGELVVAGIGIPPDLPEQAEVKLSLATSRYARRRLPERPVSGHKGRFGTALIAAGSSRYWGAPVLAARAAYRTGAGLVALAVPERIRPATASQLPEATYPPVPDKDLLGESSARWLRQEGKAQALLVGPGIGDARSFLDGLLETQSALPLPPMVIDADGLNLLATSDEWPGMVPPGSILTPHPGEMARLMGISLSELKGQDRVKVAQEQSTRWGHVVLLKGAYTVVAQPDGTAHILPFANPILGAAGSGDVLAGVIVGLLAQGLGRYESAVLGAYMHAAAGQLAAETLGDAGLLAGEITDYLPAVRKRLLAGSIR